MEETQVRMQYGHGGERFLQFGEVKRILERISSALNLLPCMMHNEMAHGHSSLAIQPAMKEAQVRLQYGHGGERFLRLRHQSDGFLRL
ncbi:unnamed protein product [Urochloa humidicola]